MALYRKKDHAEEAAGLLREVTRTGSQIQQQTLAMRAQAHATLALVEQQRLDNLIKVREALVHPVLFEADSDQARALDKVEDVIKMLDLQIHEGLRL